MIYASAAKSGKNVNTASEVDLRSLAHSRTVHFPIIIIISLRTFLFWEGDSTVGRASMTFYLGIHVNWGIFLSFITKLTDLSKCMYETQPINKFKI